MDKKEKGGSILRTCAFFTSFILMGAICAVLLWFIYKYGADTLIEELKESADAFGIWGFFLMLLIQTAQVVLAFIPGEPIEIAAGALYGTFGGTALCLIGISIGSLIIFMLVKFLGRDFVVRVIGSDKYAKLKFLKDPKKRDILIFLLMFIPGTPKDILTYFSPLAGISMLRFVVIAAIARIPSVITSTYVGGTISQNKYLHAAVVFVLVGAISILGIIIYNKIIESKNQKKESGQSGKQHRKNLPRNNCK